MKKLLAFILILTGIATFSTDVIAHGGGLDRNGCHHDNSNGSYHCHR